MTRDESEISKKKQEEDIITTTITIAIIIVTIIWIHRIGMAVEIVIRK